MTTTRHDRHRRTGVDTAWTRVEIATWLLLVTQVVHGFVPADTEAEGYVGAVGGLLLLIATMAAIFGLRTRRSWGPPLAGWTGLIVAVGFVAYHAVPVRSPVTNPYLGEPAGPPAWISVAAAVAAGAWTALAVRRATPAR